MYYKKDSDLLRNLCRVYGENNGRKILSKLIPFESPVAEKIIDEMARSIGARELSEYEQR